MAYTTSYQCPDTGLMVTARYAFGKVTIASGDDDLIDRMVASGDTTPEAATQARNDTAAYCARHTNHRCGSVDEADQYIVKVSDGQTFGFEKTSY